MDLFKAIFAESSSDSETETEVNNEKSSSPQEAAASGGVHTTENKTTPRKTRWQDLSAVANQPLSITTNLNPVTDSNLAGTESSVAAASVKKAAYIAEAATQDREQDEAFGPALPPGQPVTRSNHPPPFTLLPCRVC